MPRSTIANRQSAIFDKLLELYDASLVAISATANGAPVFFDQRTVQEYEVVINSLAYTGFVAGTALWSIALQASATQGGTYTTVATVNLDGTAKRNFLTSSGMMVTQTVPDAQWLRILATKTGAPGPLQFGAFIADDAD